MDGIAFELNPIDWTGISGIADSILVVLNVLLIASLVIGYRGIREAAVSRNADMLVWAIGQIEQLKPDLLTLYSAPVYNPDVSSQGGGWSEAQIAAANHVSVTLQRLSYLALSNMISERHLTEMWAPTFASSWGKLESWVKQLRGDNGEPTELDEGAFSRKDFEIFSRRCQAYRDRIEQAAAKPKPPASA